MKCATGKQEEGRDDETEPKRRQTRRLGICKPFFSRFFWLLTNLLSDI
jgi:hypothetical protein